MKKNLTKKGAATGIASGGTTSGGSASGGSGVGSGALSTAPIQKGSYFLVFQNGEGKDLLRKEVKPENLHDELTLYGDLVEATLGVERGDVAAKILLSDLRVNAMISFLLNPAALGYSFEDFREKLRSMSQEELKEAVKLLPTELHHGVEFPVRLDVLSKVFLDLDKQVRGYLDLEPRVGESLTRNMRGRTEYYLSLVLSSEKNVDFSNTKYQNLTSALGLIILYGPKNERSEPVLFINGAPASAYDLEVSREVTKVYLADKNYTGTAMYAVHLNGDYEAGNLRVKEEDPAILKSLKRLCQLLNALLNPDIDREERVKFLDVNFGIAYSEHLETGYEVMGFFEDIITEKVEAKVEAEFNKKLQDELARKDDEIKRIIAEKDAEIERLKGETSHPKQ